MPKETRILVHSPRYDTDLETFGIVKPFALDRGSLVLTALQKDFGAEAQPKHPEPITLETASLVHTERYLASLQDPEVWREIFELKEDEYFPDRALKPLNELIDDITLKCGGTLLAAELALTHGLSANLGGGYHHAFPDQGRGYCVLNDIAIAVASLKKRRLCQRFLIVDLDFHQGDGTALIFASDPDVFTLSVHSHEGWPDNKQKSSLDVPIRVSETHLYLAKLEAALTHCLERFTPELVVFVAGSDPYELDVLPGSSFIKLTLSEMRQRDELVIDTFCHRGIPLAMVFAGGYGPDVWEVHYLATRHLLTRAIRIGHAP